MNNLKEKILSPGNGINENNKEDRIKSIIKNLAYYVKVVKENKKNIIKINIVFLIALLAILLFLVHPFYQSSIVILPDMGNSLSTMGGLTDLASLAGVNIGENSPTEIYQNLVQSEAVMEQVIYKKYKTEEFSEPVNLIKYFDIESNEDNPEKAKREEFLKAYKMLTESRIETEIERLTKILTITVYMPESELSADVANAIVASLDEYIQNKRKSFATKQIAYVERRIDQVKDSLTISENALINFKNRNRLVVQSPNLMLTQGRMERNIEIEQAVFVELNKQLEIARIDQIRDTPVINYRETAQDPIKKAGPPRTKIFITLCLLFPFLSSAYFIYKPKLISYRNLLKEN